MDLEWIAIFSRALTRSVEPLTAEDRWRRILAEALKKFLHGREPGRQPWLPPLGPRQRAEIDPEIDRPDRTRRVIVPLGASLFFIRVFPQYGKPA